MFMAKSRRLTNRWLNSHLFFKSYIMATTFTYLHIATIDKVQWCH